VFVLSLKTGVYGLNLVKATHVIHFDRWWNPAVENQATDRAHRIGQRKTVFVHTMICDGTLESRIDELISGKTELARQLVGSGDSWLAGLSDDKLREVLALSSSATAYTEGTE
jgi:SNF2 family DNA or RNA helicase